MDRDKAIELLKQLRNTIGSVPAGEIGRKLRGMDERDIHEALRIILPELKKLEPPEEMVQSS